MVTHSKKDAAIIDKVDMAMLRSSIGEMVLVVFIEDGKTKVKTDFLVGVNNFKTITLGSDDEYRDIPFISSNAAIRSIYQMTEIESPGRGIALYQNSFVDNALLWLYSNGPIDDQNFIHDLKVESFGNKIAHFLRE